jgi:hypothetical protein
VLEPCNAKVLRTVLRGLSASNRAWLLGGPDWPRHLRSDRSPNSDSPLPSARPSVRFPDLPWDALYFDAISTLGYLAAENRILRAQIKGRLLLSDAEKATLAEIAHRLGRKALEELAAVAKPDTLLAWYRKLIANKFGKHGCLFHAGVFTNF